MNWLWDRTVFSYLASGVAHVAALATVHTMLSRDLPVSLPVRNGVNSLAMIATIESPPVQEAALATIIATSLASGDERPGEQLVAQTRKMLRADTEVVATDSELNAELELHHPASPTRRTAVDEQPNLQPSDSPIVPRQVTVPAQPSASSQAALDSIFSAGELRESPPSPRYNPAPVWPAELLAARRSGLVLLRIRIGADGSVLTGSVHRSSGFAGFDEAALSAVQRWQFEPAERFGRAVETEILYPIRFQIVSE